MCAKSVHYPPPISASIVTDTILIQHNPAAGPVRVTTFILRFPKFINAQLAMYRMFSRSFMSTRATAAVDILRQVRDNPYIPAEFKNEVPGRMTGTTTIEAEKVGRAHEVYRRMISRTIADCESLLEIGIHREHAIRPLEPYILQTAVLTGTDFGHFFEQRCTDHAQYEIRTLANAMRDAYLASTPVERWWHIPLFEDTKSSSKFTRTEQLVVSAARCAHISYGGAADLPVDKCARLCSRLLTMKHLSPFEHQCRALESGEAPLGNLVGARQLRHIWRETNILRLCESAGK